ncbi:MAG: hypothetical protein ABJA67_08590 [Chthonomonadales bacterium]
MHRDYVDIVFGFLFLAFGVSRLTGIGLKYWATPIPGGEATIDVEIVLMQKASSMQPSAIARFWRFLIVSDTVTGIAAMATGLLVFASGIGFALCAYQDLIAVGILLIGYFRWRQSVDIKVREAYYSARN